MKKQSIPSIETERLILRQAEPRDIPEIFALFSNHDVMKYDGGFVMTDLGQARDFIFLVANPIWYALKQSVTWIFIEKSSGKLVGTGGLKNWSEGEEAETGLDVAKAFWKKGYGQEALNAMLYFARHSLKLNRIVAWVVPENKAAIRLLERSNFQLVGDTSHYPNGNQYVKALFYQLNCIDLTFK